MPKKTSNYVKMKVLGALENAPGNSMHQQYEAVSQMIFKDEEGIPHQFTWRTIQTWWYHYRQHGFTEPRVRVDKGALRKTSPEDLLEAVEKAKPLLKDSRRNITALYRLCIEKGFLRKEQIACNTFRRAVKKYDLLKPEELITTNKRRLAFAKAHANDLWQVDTMHGPYLKFKNAEGVPWPTQVFLICFIDDASRVVPHGFFYTEDNTRNLLDCYQEALYKRGVPKAVYADNGSNYSSKEFSSICERLGTVLIHTPVRDGAAKGKIERFFRTVRDQFLVQVRYLNRDAFSAELFYLEESRKIRNDNTFSFKKRRFEAPRDLRGKRILIRYNRTEEGMSPPVVYEDGTRLGFAILLVPESNDRKPNLEPLFNRDQADF